MTGADSDRAHHETALDAEPAARAGGEPALSPVPSDPRAARVARLAALAGNTAVVGALPALQAEAPAHGTANGLAGLTRRPRPGGAARAEPDPLGAQLSRAVLSRAFLLRAPPAAPVVAAPDAAARAETIKEAFGGTFSEDEERALDQIRGQNPATIRAITDAYRNATGGRSLILDFRRYCSQPQFQEAMGYLLAGTSLGDRIRSTEATGWYIQEGWFLGAIPLNTTNQKAILDELEHATPGDLEVLKGHREAISFIESKLEGRDLFAARKRIWPERLYEHVRDFLLKAGGVFDDDEGGAAVVVLELQPSDRMRLWQENEKRVFGTDLFGFMGEDERRSMERICTGSEAVALTEAMRLATEGAGTDDEAVKALIAKAAEAEKERKRVDAEVKAGKAADGTPLTPEQIDARKKRLAELGATDTLLAPRRDFKGEIDKTTFLGMVADDVGEAELGAYMAELGVDEYERAKQALLDAIGTFSDDEDAVYKAFQSLDGKGKLPPEAATASPEERRRLQQEADRTLRLKLRNDPEVQIALQSLNAEELRTLDVYVQGDPYAVKLVELTSAYEGLDTDEEGIFKVVCSMSEEQRARLRKEPIYTRIRTEGYLDAAELRLFDESVRTGKIPTELAVKWATQGLGTEDEMLEQTFAAMDQAERDEYRLGYFLWKGHSFGDQPNEEVRKKREAAKRKFAELYEELDDDLDGESLIKALDALLGRGSLTDLSTEMGRLMAVEIMRDRMLEKTEQRRSLRGRVSGGIVDQFSDTGEVEDLAFARFESQYQLAKADGRIDFDEYSKLLALEGEYAQRHQEHVAAGDTVANVAATAAAIVVAIVATAASGGTLGPAAAALVTQVGGPVVASGIGGALAKVTVTAAIKGERYEGADAARDALTGAVEGATAAAGASLSASFLQLVGISQEALAAGLTASIIRAGEVGVAQLGKQMAVGSLKAAIEGVIGGVAGEVVMTTMDAKVWQGKVFDVIEAYGLAILRGAATGAATGVLVGGPLEILAVYTGTKRLQGVIRELEAIGYPREKVTESLARAVGAADAALGAKRPLDAAEALKGSGLSDEEAEKIWRALAKSHGKDPGQWPRDSAPPSSSAPETATPVTRQIERLKAKYGDSHQFTQGTNGVNLNGELDIHPDLLAQIPDAHLDRIVDATAKLRAAGGDLNAIASEADRAAVKKTLDDFAKSLGPTGLRLRFRYQLENEVDALLADLGLTGHFPELTPEQRARLWDLVNERPKQTPKRHSTRSLLRTQEKMAADWAKQGTRDPIVFVDRFQHWNAVVDNEVKRLEQALDAAWAAAPDPKERMLPSWGEANLGRTNITTKKDAEDAIWETVLDSSKTNREADQNWRLGEKRVAGRVGAHAAGAEVAGLPDDQLVAAVRAAPELKFAQESTAIYHPDKPGHWAGMPEAHKGRMPNHFEDYVRSANETIRNPAARTTVKVGQDGSKTVIFEVTYPQPGGDVTMQALVRVSPEGDMILATYMPRKK